MQNINFSLSLSAARRIMAKVRTHLIVYKFHWKFSILVSHLMTFVEQFNHTKKWNFNITQVCKIRKRLKWVSHPSVSYTREKNERFSDAYIFQSYHGHRDTFKSIENDSNKNTHYTINASIMLCVTSMLEFHSFFFFGSIYWWTIFNDFDSLLLSFEMSNVLLCVVLEVEMRIMSIACVRIVVILKNVKNA